MNELTSNFVQENDCLSRGERALIVHYHLFKNAGTSIDEILRQNFGLRFEAREFSLQERSAASVARYLEKRPELLALSSHTALLPVAQPDKRFVFPILFIRHPMDRLRSAYDFERVQRADTPGAVLAKTQDFAGYLRALLSRKRSQARNFQAGRLALNDPGRSATQLERARRTIEILPFVGLVECYQESIECLQEKLRPIFPQFKAFRVRKNISPRSQGGLLERLETLKKEIGAELYKAALMANTDDMEVFNQLAVRYNFHL